MPADPTMSQAGARHGHHRRNGCPGRSGIPRSARCSRPASAVFVDLLKWDVPVLDGRFEVDQFDDEHATYLIVADEAGGHLPAPRGSSRPDAAAHPRHACSPTVRGAAADGARACCEITRFCLDRRQSAQAQRLETRNRLGLGAGATMRSRTASTTYTGVAEMGWLQQILAFGWRCRPLGLPRAIDGRMLGALRIDITRRDARPARGQRHLRARRRCRRGRASQPPERGDRNHAATYTI